MTDSSAIEGTTRAGEGTVGERLTRAELNVAAYEHVPIMNALIRALHEECRGQEFVIFRDAFRWKRHTGDLTPGMRGSVINNGYEMFCLEGICADNGWKIVYDFNHAAIVTPAATPQANTECQNAEESK